MTFAKENSSQRYMLHLSLIIHFKISFSIEVSQLYYLNYNTKIFG